MIPVIEFCNVSVQEQGAVLLNNLSFAVKENEHICFYGKSGAGITSIFKTLLGIYSLSAGKVLFSGEMLTAESYNVFWRDVAYLSQEPVLGAKTVKEALLLPYTYKSNRGKEPNIENVKSLLDKLSLNGNILEQSAQTISGGEKQRIVIARALLMQKTVFLCDEITSSLDEETAKLVWNIFKEQKCTTISISHEPDWIENCDYSYQMVAGTIV